MGSPWPTSMSALTDAQHAAIAEIAHKIRERADDGEANHLDIAEVCEVLDPGIVAFTRALRERRVQIALAHQSADDNVDPADYIPAQIPGSTALARYRRRSLGDRSVEAAEAARITGTLLNSPFILMPTTNDTDETKKTKETNETNETNEAVEAIESSEAIEASESNETTKNSEINDNTTKPALLTPPATKDPNCASPATNVATSHEDATVAPPAVQPTLNDGADAAKTKDKKQPPRSNRLKARRSARVAKTRVLGVTSTAPLSTRSLKTPSRSEKLVSARLKRREAGKVTADTEMPSSAAA